MRKIIYSFAALLLVVLTTVSCKNENSPKSVATTWLNGFYHMDYEAAKKVSTEETKKLLSQLQQFTTVINDSMKKEMKKTKIEIKNVKEDGDKARVMYTISESPTKEQPLDLVKQDGKWMVNFSKNDSPGEAADNTTEQGSPEGVDTTAPADADVQDTMKH